MIVGADRIAANGDVANKVGTYPLAVLADRHGVPFYVAAPLSTIDPATPDGAAIPIEERDPAEVVDERRRLQPRIRRDPRRACHRDRDRGRRADAALPRRDRACGRTRDDADALLSAARRPLVLGIGGGGDVVGALATAELAAPMAPSRSWAASPGSGGRSTRIPGPRAEAEIEGARRLAPGVLAANGSTRVRESGVLFAESRMARAARRGDRARGRHARPGRDRGRPGGRGRRARRRPDRVRGRGRRRPRPRRRARPGEPALRRDHAAPPRAATSGRARTRPPVLGGIFGVGCDGELSPPRCSSGSPRSRRGRLRRRARAHAGRSPHASSRPSRPFPPRRAPRRSRCFHGAIGETTIRQGRRTVELSPVGALTFYFDVAQGDLVRGAPGGGRDRRRGPRGTRTRSSAPAASAPSSTTSVMHCTQFDRHRTDNSRRDRTPSRRSPGRDPAHPPR